MPDFDLTPKGKTTCPACQHKKRYRTFEGYDKKYGVCDRINSCGHRHFPEGKPMKFLNDSTNPTAVIRQLFPEKDQIDDLLKSQNSAFHKYCIESLSIYPQHLIKWLVGGNEYGSTSFIVSNQENHLNVKSVKYKENGSRDKKVFPRYLKAPNKESEYKRCFYGLHLFDDKKITCIVESEKSAVIASHFYPEYNWLASGGNNGITSELTKPLQGYQVVFLQDADKAGRNSRGPEILRRNGAQVSVIDLFPERQDGYDIADAIRDRKQPALDFQPSDFNQKIALSDLFEVEKEKTRFLRAPFILYLEQEGFCRVNSRSGYRYALIKDQIVSKVDSSFIREFFLDKVRKNECWYNAVVLNASLNFSEAHLSCLKLVELPILSDSDSETYLPYQNGVLEITKNGKKLIPYKELDEYVYKSHIIDRPIDFYSNQELEGFMFYKFLWRIAGEDNGRLLSLMSSLGYIMNSCIQKQQALILTDATLSDHPEGRSGKTLIVQALSKIRQVASIDAKTIKGNDRFRFQKVQEHTTIVAMNDVSSRKTFSIEPFFPAITEGIEVEKKNKDPFSIKCRMIFTSKKAIQTLGGSAKDRVIEFELSTHYNQDHSPKDEFGKWFFDDWNMEEWNQFDLIMTKCIQLYHEFGVVKASPIHLAQRKVIDATSAEFFEFAECLELGKEYCIKEEHEKFTRKYPGYDSLKSRTFSNWLRIYGAVMQFNFDDRRSNGQTLFIISAQVTKESN